MPVNRWNGNIDVKDYFDNAHLSFEECRDGIIDQLKKSNWYKGEDLDLLDVIEELELSEDVQEFDVCWNALYDLADRDRIWIATV